MIIRQTNSSNFANLCLVAILALCTITPILINIIPPAITIGLSILWLIVSVGQGKFFTRSTDFTRWWIIFLIWQAAMVIIGHSNILVYPIIGRIPAYCVAFILPYVMRFYSIKEKKKLQFLLFAIVVINLLDNIYIGIINPDLFKYFSLELAQGGDVGNAGRTNFVTVCLFLGGVALLILFHSKAQRVKMLMIALIALIIWYVAFINSRATAVIVFLLMTASLFLVHRANAISFKKNKIIYIVGGGILSVIIIVFLIKFQDQFAGNERLFSRIDELSAILQTGDIMDVEGSFSGRIILGMTSLKTFTASIPNFFFGIGERVHDLTFSDLVKSGVGHHSQILDCLAEYGIIGGYLLFQLFRQTFKYILSMIDNPQIRIETGVIFVFFVFYSILNNTLSADILFVVILLLPLVAYNFNESSKVITKKNNKYE